MYTVQTGQEQYTETAGVPAFARVPVLVIAGLAFAVLLFTSSRYAHGFDELYFLVAGRDHLDWGYFDQPPLIPLLAGGLDTLFPGSLVALRLPVTLAAAAGVAVTALIAREFGGGRGAQAMAAGAYATSGVVLASHWIATYVLDPFLWTVIAWLVVRWVRTRRDGLLLWAGLVTAVSLQTKFVIPAFWVLLLLSSLVLGPRDLIRRPKLLLGGAIAVVVTVPTLVWQARHGWPYTQMGDVVSAEFPGVLGFLREGALGAGGFGFGALIFLYGVWRLFRSPELRPYRFIGLAIVLLVVAFLLTQGRAYYLLSLFAVPFGAAAAEFSRRNLVRWWKAVVWPVFLLSAVFTVSALPVIPRSMAETSFGPLTFGSVFSAGELPFEELGQQIGGSFAALPADRKPHTAMFAEIYPFAAAVEYYGRADGIPTVYSGHRGYWYFDRPPESMDSVLFAGSSPDLLRPYFATVTPVVDGLVWRFDGRRESWDKIWPALQRQ